MSGKKIISISKDMPLEKIYSTEYSVLAYIGYRTEAQNAEKRELLRTHSRQLALDEVEQCVPICDTAPFTDPYAPMLLSAEIVESKYCDGVLESEKIIFTWQLKDSNLKGEFQ